MTLVQYLDLHDAGVSAWPGGETTWRRLVGITRGVGVDCSNGEGRDALLNCFAVLRRIADGMKSDPILRTEAIRYLATVRGTLRKAYQVDPDPETLH